MSIGLGMAAESSAFRAQRMEGLERRWKVATERAQPAVCVPSGED